MTVELQCIYQSCACNKTLNAIDWGNNNIICYSACNAVHLYTYEKSSGPAHIQSLTKHTKLITSVQWIRKSDSAPEDELLVTSADNTASLWKLSGTSIYFSCSLTGHTSVVQKGTGIYSPENGKLIIVTLSTDSSVKLWERNTSEVQCIQTISFGNGFGLDVKLASLNNGVIMALSIDDSKLHLYVQDTQGYFIPAVKLTGHEDWIQSIDILKNDKGNLMIATASQDNYIRIWKIASYLPENNSSTINELNVDATTFQSFGESYSVSLESIIGGHENWVYSVQWKYFENGNILQLLSASMDKTIIIWEFDASINIWMEKETFGEVGGNTLGFFGAVFSPNGENIIAHGHQGSVHVWQLNQELGSWEPGLSMGGHFSSVQDIDWDPEGEFLVSCSSDQTTRLHAPYVISESKNNWYEISRPQIHGYDMVCLAMLDRFKFVSAGDEKVLRVFEAPRSFAENLANLTKLNVSSYLQGAMPEGASIPSLGLSNKAVFSEDIIKAASTEETETNKHPKDRYPDFYYSPTSLTAPPTEETLLQNTLWPETQKLYGHPYEVFTVASNHAGTLIASACKASKVEHAGIILWDTSTWRQASYLAFHSLTVTQLEFSPDDQYLLSVSRDRMWALYRYTPEESTLYEKVANLDKKSGVHARIIWSCSWSFDNLYFATSSRDKKVAMWSKNKDELPGFSLCSKPLDVEDSATAVSIAPCLVKDRYLIAIGLENGSIILSIFSNDTGWEILQKLDQNIAHHLNINRLKFSPVLGEAGCREKNSGILQLASCSNDHHIKIYNIFLSSIR
ncbi:elongator complex protein 2-like [Argiope bruennichi]|uniref:Elongator complex protein 2 n=1 Tax=Argiope bruennichi TaxID=94029 RepID=A0A8T0FBL0_ARGBR|nr:elongator complex protein 2-like [Argiope bruennichi]KAF8788664.1 Elongator complex protein 2 like protein [Argiope bruennichi]